MGKEEMKIFLLVLKGVSLYFYFVWTENKFLSGDQVTQDYLHSSVVQTCNSNYADNPKINPKYKPNLCCQRVARASGQSSIGCRFGSEELR